MSGTDRPEAEEGKKADAPADGASARADPSVEPPQAEFDAGPSRGEAAQEGGGSVPPDAAEMEPRKAGDVSQPCADGAPARADPAPVPPQAEFDAGPSRGEAAQEGGAAVPPGAAEAEPRQAGDVSEPSADGADAGAAAAATPASVPHADAAAAAGRRASPRRHLAAIDALVGRLAQRLTPFGGILLVLFTLVVFLPGFFSIPPLDRDEPRFAQATKQMLQTGDFIDIRFQDEARLKKPAGIYWLQAAAAAASGKGADAPIWVYRIPSLLGALAAVFLTFWVALPIAGRQAAMLAALAMAACVLLGVEARIAKTDAVLLALTLIVQGALARALFAKDGPLPRFVVFVGWTALGLGILVKGPVIVMVSAFTVLFSALAARRIDWFGRLSPLPGALWTLLIVVPWLTAILVITKGEFIAASIGQDLLGKVVEAKEQHGAPPGAYLGVFWATFWPAAPFFALALPWLWERRRDMRIFFLIAWVVPAWAIFEAIPTKLPHYVLPLYPAIAIATAMAITAGAAGTAALWRRLVLVLVPVLAAAVAVAVPVARFVLDGSVSLVGTVLAVIGAALALAAWWLALRQGAGRGLVVAALAGLVLYTGVFQFLLPGTSAIWLSPRLAEAARNAAGCPDPMVATAGFREPSLVFLTRTDLVMTNAAGAAEFLAGEGCRAVFVESRNEEAFRREAEERNIPVRLAARIAGFNINGGDTLDIGVYVPPARQ